MQGVEYQSWGDQLAARDDSEAAPVHVAEVSGEAAVRAMLQNEFEVAGEAK